MTRELAELVLVLNAAGLSVLVALLPLAWPSIVKPVRRFQQNVVYAHYYALHRPDPTASDMAGRFDVDLRQAPEPEQQHTVAYGELPYYVVPKAGA